MTAGVLVLMIALMTGLLTLAIYYPFALHKMNKEWSKLLAAERTRDSERLIKMYTHKEDREKHLLMLLSAKHLTEYGQVLDRLERDTEEPSVVEKEEGAPFPSVQTIQERVRTLRDTAAKMAAAGEATSPIGGTFVNYFEDREVS